MTSTTDTAGHPDVAELSDLTEGLPTPSRTTELRRHLDGCEVCADTYASLEEIRELLGTLPEPVAMPEDVALRIDAALAAEAGAGASEAEVAGAGVAGAGVAAEASDVSRETSAPDRTPGTSDRPSGHPRATTGPGRKTKGRPRSRRRTAAVLGVFTAAALGLGSVLLSSLAGSDGDSGGPTAADTFSKGTLQESVDAALQAHRSSSRSPKGDVGIQGTVESPQVLSAPNVPACVLKGTARTDSALASKEGVYEGKDVLLVVFRNASDRTHVDAYLVDRACEQHPATQADVLLKHSYAQP
ncbi:anti-sigma factor family protein [Streptomyces niveiscabiei]|uniref:Anti-sigma factor family protein n=1 Tax=Streptomyces niveiscabiei TaxID=164115 RepID=A0ABW9I0G0_9ACTN